MIQFGQGLPATVSVPVVLRVGDTEQEIATFLTPETSTTPPTREEIGRVLREVAGLFANAPEGVMIPKIVSYLDRP